MNRLGDLQRILESSGWVRVQVDQYHVVRLDVWCGCKELVDLDTSHVRQPYQSRLVIADNVSGGFVQALGSYRCGSDPVRMVRPVFLHEGFSWDAVRVAVEHQGPVADERDHLGCDGQIVLDNVGFGDSFLLP